MAKGSPPQRPLGRILVVDDEKELRHVLGTELEAADYRVQTAANADEASKLLGQGWDLVLTDLHMPGLGIIPFLRNIREQCPEAELIVMTGYGSIESAVEALKEGAHDFLQKPLELDDLLAVAAKAVGKVRVRTSEVYLRGLLDANLDAILAVDLDGDITLWNAGAKRLFGFEGEEVLGRRVLAQLLPSLARSQESALERARRSGQWVLEPGPWRTSLRRKDGCLMPVELTTTPVRTERGLKGLVQLVREFPRGMPLSEGLP